jgi:hypothetical protein
MPLSGLAAAAGVEFVAGKTETPAGAFDSNLRGVNALNPIKQIITAPKRAKNVLKVEIAHKIFAELEVQGASLVSARESTGKG